MNSRGLFVTAEAQISRILAVQIRLVKGHHTTVAMSALGQKQTHAVQQRMSALPPIATAKADIRKRSCPLCTRKQTCGALAYVCYGPIADMPPFRVFSSTSQYIYWRR